MHILMKLNAAWEHFTQHWILSLSNILDTVRTPSIKKSSLGFLLISTVLFGLFSPFCQKHSLQRSNLAEKYADWNLKQLFYFYKPYVVSD